MRKKEYEALLEASERGKKEMFIHFTEKVARLRKELDDARTGAGQINAALNSILIGAALDHDGSITIPKNHFEYLDMYDYEVKDDGENFVFTVTPKSAEDDLPFEEGQHEQISEQEN